MFFLSFIVGLIGVYQVSYGQEIIPPDDDMKVGQISHYCYSCADEKAICIGKNYCEDTIKAVLICCGGETIKVEKSFGEEVNFMKEGTQGRTLANVKN